MLKCQLQITLKEYFIFLRKLQKRVAKTIQSNFGLPSLSFLTKTENQFTAVRHVCHVLFDLIWIKSGK